MYLCTLSGVATNKKKIFFSSELQELEVRICVKPNFPITVLILLNGFHKFPRSRGLNSSGAGSQNLVKTLSNLVLTSSE